MILQKWFNVAVTKFYLVCFQSGMTCSFLHPPKWCAYTQHDESSNSVRQTTRSSSTLSCFFFNLSILGNVEGPYFRSNFINLNVCWMTIWVGHLTLIWSCRTSLPYSDGTILGTRHVGFSTRGKSNTMHRSMMTLVACCSTQTQEVSIMNKLWRGT